MPLASSLSWSQLHPNCGSIEQQQTIMHVPTVAWTVLLRSLPSKANVSARRTRVECSEPQSCDRQGSIAPAENDSLAAVPRFGSHAKQASIIAAFDHLSITIIAPVLQLSRCYFTISVSFGSIELKKALLSLNASAVLDYLF